MAILELEGGFLSESAVAVLRENTDMLACQCPGKLLEILDMVRNFAEYSSTCAVDNPADAQTHIWLRTAATNLDKLLSGTIMQLARMEGFVDDANQVVKRTK